MNRQYWGIYRERPHSPGRIDDDAAIMQAVAAALGDQGLAVELIDAEAVDSVSIEPGARIFAMCEQEAILTRLQRAAAAGAVVVNSPAAIRNTYRARTVERFALCGVAAPASWIVPTDTAGPPPARQVWVKRADFHATQADDVLFADSEAEWSKALAQFARRGMGRVVVQAHVPGDLIKFYGVQGPGGGAPWFDWFYHKGQTLSGHAFDPARLAAAGSRAAAALGVQVFGGDAIVGPDGAPSVIDLNAWPSFATRRAVAAPIIARHLASVFARAPIAARTFNHQAEEVAANG